MKLLLIAFAVIAAVAADVSHLPSNEYLPPVQESASIQVQAPSNEYLAPVQQAAPAPIQVEAAPAHELADDGYRYKTHRRVVYRRHRRDVSHLPSNDYLPPVQQSAPVQVQAQAPTNEYLPPVQQAAPAQFQVEAAPAHELADDGYRYKTHRRVVYRRHRRDVSHLPSNEYLPPQQSAPVQVQSNDIAYAPAAQEASAQFVQEAPIQAEAAPAHELADDGYRYKTHRRVVYRRHRRDVSHLPSNDYLPPVQQSAPVQVQAQAPTNEYLPPVQQAAPAQFQVEAAPAHELADDGYRYKTHRRVVYRRHRRDVSNEYLPPVQESASIQVQAPSNEYLAPVQQAAPAPIQVEAAPAHELADDGYRYKTHRRVVYRRHRRDVSNEYLPPVQESASIQVQAPSNEYLAPVQQAAPAPIQVEAAPAHELADDGYRYKTHRRVVYRRHRRDVSNEYLPPVQESASIQVQAPSNEYLAPVQQAAPAPIQVEAAPAHELADDGYRYKTHRRVVYRRHRRDVSNEYLPPVQESASIQVQAPSNEYLAPVQQAAPAPIQVEAAPAHELADDGYRYKTHRRVVYRRHRRDVSNEYLPPVQESASIQVQAPSNDYQVSVQHAGPGQVQVEAAPAHELADDGYRYKTHRRVVYRRH